VAGPLLNVNLVLQCVHGGVFPVVPRGPRPIVGGAPGLNVTDFPGVPAVGCVFNVLGVPAPCVIVSVMSGMCPKVIFYGAPTVDQTLVCMTSNGMPTLPISNPGQVIAQSV
jgi:hypothetical protein